MFLLCSFAKAVFMNTEVNSSSNSSQNTFLFKTISFFLKSVHASSQTPTQQKLNENLRDCYKSDTLFVPYEIDF